MKQGWSGEMLKLRTKIEAISLVSLLIILSFSSAWAVTRNIQSNKETISGGTYYYSGNYDFINNSHFNLSNKIYNSKGHVWNASGANIQLAIDDLTTGTVQVPIGTITITVPIQMKSGIKVMGWGRDATIIQISGNVSAFTFLGTATNYCQYTQLCDLTIKVGSKYTGSAIVLNASDIVSGAIVKRNILERIEIKNDYGTYHNYTGINISSYSTGGVASPSCCYNVFKDITIWYCGKGIVLQTTGTGTAQFICVNSFENILIMCPIIGVYFQENTPKNIFDNKFTNVEIQGVTWIKYGFENISQRSMLTNCFVWDWGLATSPIYKYEINENSNGTTIIGSEPYDSYWKNNGEKTTVIYGDEGAVGSPNTHYVFPTGSKDATKFWRMVNSSSTGDSFIFVPGWYDWNRGVVISKKVDIYLLPGVNITNTIACHTFYLSGDGSIVHGTGTIYGNNSAFAGSYYNIFITGNNIVVKDITINSAISACIYINQYALGTIISGVVFKGTTEDECIRDVGGQKTIIENCYMSANSMGIVLEGVAKADTVVKDNTITLADSTGGITVFNMTRSRFTGNKISYPSPGHGIYVSAKTENCSFDHNFIFAVASGVEGIQIGNTGTSHCNNNTIENNWICGFAVGIYIQSGNRTLISDNRFVSCTTGISSIYSTRQTIDNNIGYATENKGNTSVANNGTISHGLGAAPTVVVVTTFNVNLTAHVTAMSATTFKVCLIDVHTGSPPGGSWPVFWEAKV